MTATQHRTGYHDTLRTLSEASVDQHFDAFVDIAWDDPAYAVDPRDERWILPEADVLGATEWYRSLPRERQIQVGLYRQANVTKVGLQFEQVLIAGLMNFAFTAAQRHPGVPLRHPRGDRGVPPHPDVPGVREPLRGRRGRCAAAVQVPRAVPAAGRATGSRSASSSACWPARSPSTTCRSRSCARVSRDPPAAPPDHADPRRRGGPAHRLRAPVRRAQGAAAQAAPAVRARRSPSR